ncbi:MAG: VOC family protein [Bryobacterales bacterium]|nr:VOC family protein [Bryobacteraceae bacterium]MDW8131526.1 VOC family protein [Bryobacterales bacterium]
MSDLKQARTFQADLLGFEWTFRRGGTRGTIERVFLKVYDGQFLQLVPGLQPGASSRFAHIAIRCRNVGKLHRALRERGLDPTAIETRADGQPGSCLTDPGGTRLEFLERVTGGRQLGVRRNFLGARRIAERLWHARGGQRPGESNEPVRRAIELAGALAP